MKLLHLDSSVQGDASLSRKLSAAIVDSLRPAHPNLEVAYRDLATRPLPHITIAGLASDQAGAVLEEFLAADIVVIGSPMYNLGIPSQLKTWFDHVLVAGKTFRYEAEGAVGLMGGKQVIVAHSRGGIYSEGPASAAEHAESHLRAMLGFIGIRDVEFVLAEGVAVGPRQRETALVTAFSQIARLQSAVIAA